MSNVRVRYSKPVDGVLTSRRNFTTAAGNEVKVELNTNTMMARVVDSVTGGELSSVGGTVNVSVLKIKGKELLQALGVVFGDEERKRDEAGTASTGQ